MKLHFNFNYLPNTLSIIRIALTPLFIYLFWQEGNLFIVGIIIFSIAALTDWYDGYVARKYDSISNIGMFLDPLADKVLIWSAFICCALKGLFAWWMIAVIIARDFFVTTLRISTRMKKINLPTSRIAKYKTAGQFSVLYTIFLYILLDNSSILLASNFLMLIIVGLSIYTSIDYGIQHYTLKKHLKGIKPTK